MDDDFDDFDDSFLAAVDQLVAAHQGKATQLTQPDSPNARAAGEPPAAAAQPPPAQPQFQQPQQPMRPPSAQLLQHPLGGQPQHKPPFPTFGVHAAPPHTAHPAVGPGPTSGAGSGFPVGRVTQAAADLRAQPPLAGGALGTGVPPGDLSHLLAQLQQERDRLQQQLGSAEGTNKLLRSNLDQAERERHSLRQRLQQMEAKGPAAGQPSFTQLELQRQLETLKQQLMFREQEMEDMKRQQGDKLERLREAEAAVQSLQAQIKQGAAQQQQAAKKQQQQQSCRNQRHQDASPSAGGPQRSSLRQQQQQQAQAPRTSGHKWRQSAAGELSSAAPQASPAVSAPPAAGPVAASAQTAPLLGPSILAAALDSSSSSADGLVSRLWAVCGPSMGMLLGAAPEAGGSAPDGPLQQHGPEEAKDPAARGPSPTALLLRMQAKSVAGGATPGVVAAAGFCHAFSQQLQQAAAGLLHPAALVDSIGAMVAGLVVEHCQPSRTGALAGGAATGPGQRQGGAAGAELPQQDTQLLADALVVLQHLIEQDAGCRQAAAGSSCSIEGQEAGSAPPGRLGCGGTAGGKSAELLQQLQLSNRVCLSGMNSSGQQAGPGPAPLGTHAALPQCQAIVQLHDDVFGGKGHGLAAVLVAVSSLAGRRQEQVLAAALGALCALASGMPVGGGRAALKPVLETGALELFLRPPGLWAPALRLLHLLLEEPALVQALEQSLALAAGSGPDSETPGSGGGGTAGATGDGPSGPSRLSGSKGGPPDPPGAEPMQVDAGPAATGAWAGAAAVLRRLLQSLSLPSAAAQPAAHRPVGHAHRPHAQQQPQSGPQSRAAGHEEVAHSPASLPGCPPPDAAPRQALQLVAMLREARVHSLLAHLVQTEDGSEGLCQKLVQLAEAASAQQGADAATAPLLPAQCPSSAPAELSHTASGASGASGGSSVGSSAEASLAQLAWQQRLRMAQEALTLLRGLLLDEALGAQALEELASSPATSRLCLATLSRLMRLQPPGQHVAGTGALPPLPLAPWARAIGSSSSAAGGSINPGGGRGVLACCSTEDVAYMARSLRHRLLHRLKAAQ